jgi:hypothetical protein
MNKKCSGRPDSLAQGVSHAAVGIVSAALATYVLVGLLGMRKASTGFQLVAAAGGIWLHHQLDMPIAKRLAAAGL